MDDSLVRSMVLIEDAEVNFKMILLTIYMYQHFGRWYKGCPSLPVLHFFNIVQTAFDPPLLPPSLPFNYLEENVGPLRGHLFKLLRIL